LVGDIIRIKPHHLPPARDIVSLVKPKIQQSNGVYIITVGGESGSGKSTLSLAVEHLLKQQGIHCFIFHMDDYFKLPPKDNHDQRLEDISKVGPGEVDLELLQDHLDQCRQGAKIIKKPLVHYRENKIREIIVEMEGIEVIIAEGTYVSLLKNIDCKIFMLRNYLDTYEDRVKRARDPIIPFNEKVLKIEHDIVKKHRKLADILVDARYKVSPQSDKFNQN
jgi:uridine kinase